MFLFSNNFPIVQIPNGIWISLEVEMMPRWRCLLHPGLLRAGSQTPVPLAALREVMTLITPDIR